MLFQQVAEAEDRGLIRDPVADQIHASEPVQGGNIKQGPIPWVDR